MDGTLQHALIRWLRYNVVGMMGFVVQTATLMLLLGWTGLSDLAALGLAVLVALSHNFFWHERVTWPDRPPEERFARWAWFHLSTGTGAGKGVGAPVRSQVAQAARGLIERGLLKLGMHAYAQPAPSLDKT